MEAKAFAERDKQWGARYLLVLAGQDGVNREIVVRRQNELVDSIAAAGVSADELFGDPGALARADAAEIGSADADAEAAESLGMRDVFAYLTGMSLLAGAIAGGTILFDGSGPVDIRAGATALTVGIFACLVFAAGAVAFFTVGRVKSTLWMGAAAIGALVLGGVATGVWGDRVVIAGVPRWSVATALLLLPSALMFALWRLVPARTPQTHWTDVEWFERFRGTLRAKGVPSDVAKEHERSLRAELTTSAFEDFGAPGAMAQRLAGDDPRAESRRLWRWTAFWSGAAALNLLLALDDGGSPTIVRVALSVVAVLLACVTATRAWKAGQQKASA